MWHSLIEFLESWPGPALAAGIIALLYGGHLLVDGSIAIARRFGLSPLLIGLTIVAFGTSSPELAFNLIAALDDASDLSFGNIVGSNIANIGLVLGLAALAFPIEVHSRILQRELPIVLLISLVMLGMAWFQPHELLETRELQAFARADGLLLLVGFGVFLWLMARLARSDRAEAELIQKEAGISEDAPVKPLGLGVVMFVVGLATLLAGGKMAEVGAIGVARWLDVSEVVIALIIVAVATSLPEVATSFVAARRGESDLAVGNVVGSNIFNILLVMGMTATISPVTIPAGGMADLIWMTGIAGVLAVIVISLQLRIPRSAGLVLLALYAAFLAFRLLGGGLSGTQAGA